MTSVSIRYQEQGGDEVTRIFRDRFVIGRDKQCDVSIDSTEISRKHAEVFCESGTWWLKDLGSSNGTFCEGVRIDRVKINFPQTVQLATTGPSVTIQLVDAESGDAESRPSKRDKIAPRVSAQSQSSRRESDPTFKRIDAAPESRPSEQDLLAHYVDGTSAADPGDKTIFIRGHFRKQEVKHERQRIYIIAFAIGLTLVGLTIAAFMAYSAEQEKKRYSAVADEMFYQIKELDLLLRELTRDGGSGSQEAVRSRLNQRKVEYEAKVLEYGALRPMTDGERLIHLVAHDFRESQTEIPARFIREVNNKIDNFWLKEGRQSFIAAIQKARNEEYVDTIAREFVARDLPVDFFYLALQESKFDVKVVGPETRYGYAKGMWQFIPATAENFGLSLGPDVDRRRYDPGDERHNFQKSTTAAANYIEVIYETLAQASGLLAMASYNWGEHRIVKRLPDPDSFAGIERTIRERSYWNFYEKYSDRMPDETKDYVIKIFSAAVIGRDPRRFGFDFDDPLAKYRP